MRSELNELNEIVPGFRVIAYDSADTQEHKVGTVVKRYGFISTYIEREHGREAAKYPDCCDIRFDHNQKVSKGHFTYCLQVIN